MYCTVSASTGSKFLILMAFFVVAFKGPPLGIFLGKVFANSRVTKRIVLPVICLHDAMVTCPSDATLESVTT